MFHYSANDVSGKFRAMLELEIWKACPAFYEVDVSRDPLIIVGGDDVLD